MTITENPLLSTEFKIPFDQIQPAHVEPAIDHLIAQCKERLEYLAAAPERKFQNFIIDLDLFTQQVGRVNTIAHHLHGVVKNDEWDVAIQAILPKTSQLQSELSFHSGLWQALKAYSETAEAKALDPVWARFLKLQMDEFKRAGADLSDEEKAKLMKLNTELAQVANQFSQNVLAAMDEYELYVPTERLKGVPQRIQEATRRDAEERNKEGHRLTLHTPVIDPILTYADDRKLRHELFMALNEVGQQPERDNRPLIKQILKLRQQGASLRGYQNFADITLEERMATDGERALNFVLDLEKRTQAAFEKENNDLETFYHQQVGKDAEVLEGWDISYWQEKQRIAKYDLDTEALRPYFPMKQVLEGLFELTKRVMGVTITEASAPIWHKDVKFYEMHDENGQHLASFYTDWFPREGKRAGAWMNQFIVGGPNAEGQHQPHLALMCGNLTPPNQDGVSLLAYSEVETVFHEFGHLLHGTLSKVPVKTLASTNVAWDFVELPSQIMENWVSEHEVLDLIGRHYQTGEPMPDDLYQSLMRARNYRAANLAMRQYSFGVVDLSLHTQFDLENGDPINYAKELMQRFSPVPLPHNFGFLGRFSHVFGSAVGYGAGYYSYKWSEVLDADAFSRFAQEGIFNRETGRAFIDSVLSRGNSADPSELYREFMGRDPDPEALLRRSELI